MGVSCREEAQEIDKGNAMDRLIAFAVCLLVASASANAAEVRVLCAIALQQLLEDLGPKFEGASGHKLAITIAPLGQALKRLQDGETYDIAILPQRGIDGLAKDGKVVASTATVVAITRIGVAVRKGAPKPDVSTSEAFKRSRLAAKSITHGNPAYGGISGVHVTKVLERLGIAEQMKAKTVLLDKAGLAGVLVASGAAEIVIQPIQELVVVPGIDVVGPLPDELQDTVAYRAAIMTTAKEIAPLNALINFLRTPDAMAVVKAMGMEPG
jgi:molybdate transport system substrate-binding protein